MVCRVFKKGGIVVKKVVLKIAAVASLLSITPIDYANYVRTVYNATPFDAYVNFDVDFLKIRSFKVPPGQTIKWGQPSTGPNNLLESIIVNIDQRYLPGGYGTGIVDLATRLDRSKDTDKNDGNFPTYVVPRYDGALGSGWIGDAFKEFVFVVVGPIYETEDNARKATYKLLKVPVKDYRLFDRGWPKTKHELD